MKTIKTECPSCSATGLYEGMCESDGSAVICLSCNGTGCKEITYRPYTGRKKRRSITSIKRSRGTFVGTGVGGTGPAMTYDEFERNIPEA